MIPIRRNLLSAAVVLALAGAPVQAGPFDNSLWLGNDLGAGEAVYNTNRMGTVLRTIPVTPANGLAVDVAGDTFYVATTFTSITPYSLTTLTPKAPALTRPVSEDLAFDGKYLLSADFIGGTIDRINPATGRVCRQSFAADRHTVAVFRWRMPTRWGPTPRTTSHVGLSR